MFKKKDDKAPDAQNWYKDRDQWIRVQRNALFVISLLCAVVTAILSISMNSLIPLKSVEPFVIQIDQKTGVTQMVDPITAEEMTGNEALVRYFLAKYIRARESYYPNGWENSYNRDNYNTVSWLTQPGQAYDDYRKIIEPTNTKSWFNSLGTQGSRSIKFRSIQINDSQKATARVLIEEKIGGNTKELYQIINVEFGFAKLELSVEQRYTNPLGFVVKTYRIDEEVVTQ